MKKILMIILSLTFLFGCINDNDSNENIKKGITVEEGGEVYTLKANESYESGEIILPIEISKDDIIKSNPEVLFIKKKVKNGLKIDYAKKNGKFKKGEMIISITKKVEMENIKVEKIIYDVENYNLENKVKRNTTNTLLGDFNKNNEVELLDLDGFIEAFDTKVGESGYNVLYDIAPSTKGTGLWSEIYSNASSDNLINLLDFTILAKNYNKKLPKEIKNIVISGFSEVNVGEQITLSAIVTYTDETTSNSVTWSSANNGIAVVANGFDNDLTPGLVSGISAGNVEIKAEAGGISTSKTITVNSSDSISIYFEKPDSWTTSYIWYDENSDDVWETKVAGESPGEMENYRTGWYKKVLTTDSVTFLFNDGTWSNEIKNNGENFVTTSNIWIQKNGTITEEDPLQPTAPTIKVNPSSSNFYSETMEITINITSESDILNSYYILDGSQTILTALSKTITIGSGMNINDTKKLRVYAKNEIGETLTEEYIFTKIEEPEITNDIDNLRIFQVMVCSFMDGDPNIGYDWQWAGNRANGDIQGVINSLDYIKDSGFNAVWMTPIFTTYGGQQAHNGYFANDYFNVDPKFGTNEKLRELVETAHSKGIYILLDGVLGHNAGEVKESPLSGKKPGGSNPVNYQDGGASLQFYKDVVYYWIREYKIDGWRFDQSYQLGVGTEGHDGQNGNFYWDDIRTEIERATNDNKLDGNLWGTLGYTVGEDWEGEAGITVNTYGTNSEQGLHSAFDFPTRYRVIQALAKEEGGKEAAVGTEAEALAEGLATHESYPEWAHPNLFFDNHDTARLGALINESAGHNNNYWKRHKAAFSFMAAYSGPITTYYGSEWGDSRGGVGTGIYDGARTDGKIDGLTTEEEDLRQYVKKIMNIRNENSALWQENTRNNLLANGTQYVDYKYDSATGNKIVFALNLATNSDSFIFNVTGANTLTDEVTGENFSGSGGAFTIPMNGLEARIMTVE